MIISITDNMVKECIDLMEISYNQNDYKPYNKNERCWIEHFLKHVTEHNNGNPKYLAIADYDETKGFIKGFMLASAFVNYYTQEYVMDVKDCIVDHEYQNARTVARLFDTMIAHVKEHGGKHWRADSIRANDKAIQYTEFLQRKYNAVPFAGVHGTID
jgi:hypothetical protein